MTAAPARGLYQLAYQPLVDRTASIQLGSASGDKIVYGFDSTGERLTVKRTDAAGTTTLGATAYLRGGGAEALFVKTSVDGKEAKLFRVPGLNGLVAYSDGDGWSYVLSDHLRSTQFVFDQTSTVSADVAYQPFGPLAKTSGTVDTETLFSGQQLDPSTGLYDFHARLYDPDLGRFYAPDPAGQYPSPYLYAGNDPINFVDPSGRIGIMALGLYLPAAAIATYYGISQFTATSAWEYLGGQAVFNAVMNKDVVGRLNAGEVPWLLDLPGVGKLTRPLAVNLGRLLYNFSRDEYTAIMGVYPWTGPFKWPMVILKVYRAIQDDISRNWGPDGWGNAARHFFWMGRAERFGGRALSDAIADAHERGRPGTGHLGFYDNIADKINNLFGQYFASTQPNRDLQSIFDELKENRLLALSGEGSALFDDRSGKEDSDAAFQMIVTSYARGLAFLEKEFDVSPHFEDDERDFLCKTIGWRCPN